MKTTSLPLRRLFAVTTVALLANAAPGFAACYADYKAKQDNPLTLHYGVIELDDALCVDKGSARDVIARRIAVDGWTLLNVVSTFGAEDLEEKQESAGAYYLRY